ncbi:MAG: MFS transporter [Sphingobacterium sp.]|nr:MFS transporter [Sphingobacterium sp.]
MFRPIRFIKDEYVRAYRGLPRRAWILFAVNLVNSSGSMVIFFLSLYLTRELGLTTARAGQALSLYGVGSLVGAYAGGWLADRIGSIAVQKMSLAMCGVALIALGQVRTMAGILPLLFALRHVRGHALPGQRHVDVEDLPAWAPGQGFRPQPAGGKPRRDDRPGHRRIAGASRLPAPLLGRRPDLARRGGRVRAAVARDADRCGRGYGRGRGRASRAGAAIAAIGDADRGSERREAGEAVEGDAQARPHGRSPWRDKPFLVMLFIFFVWYAVFIQVLTTFPLYMRNVYGLAENRIGQLFAVNTILIVAVEMILMERIRKYPQTRMINISFLLLGAGLGLMPLGRGFAYGAMTVAVWTFGEMLSMPLITALISSRADDANRGRYMGMFSFIFSLAFIVGPRRRDRGLRPVRPRCGLVRLQPPSASLSRGPFPCSDPIWGRTRPSYCKLSR